MSRLLLLLFAGLKFGKLFFSVGTMLLAVGVYALVFGWRYAVGIVAMLMIHELGHFVAARQRRLPVGWPTFIPFIGAFTQINQMPHDAETDAYISLGGPLLGTVGALACYALGRGTGEPWLVAVSYTGFMINLINLIPVPPLDGGRITAVLSPRIWLLGIPALVALLFYRFSPILLVVLIMAAPYGLAALRGLHGKSPEARAYYEVSNRVRWEYAFYYVVLVGFLTMMVHDTEDQLHSVAPVGGVQSSGPADNV